MPFEIFAFRTLPGLAVRGGALADVARRLARHAARDGPHDREETRRGGGRVHVRITVAALEQRRRDHGESLVTVRGDLYEFRVRLGYGTLRRRPKPQRSVGRGRRDALARPPLTVRGQAQGGFIDGHTHDAPAGARAV